jgi:predicted RecB family nuclease
LHFNATDVYDYYKPSECARRVALKARGAPQQEIDTPFLKLLRNLGDRHEKAHLATLFGVVVLDTEDPAERERLTLQAIRDGAASIYHPRFRLGMDLDGEPLELVGEPDFLLRDPECVGYRIRDSKLARNIDAKRHRGIPLQLQIYGLLYERVVGTPPAALEVHTGKGEIVPIDYIGAEAVLAELRRHRVLRAGDPAAYEPVGLSKCGGCGYEDRCWDEAIVARDVSLLPPVDQKKARTLHARGITSIDQIPPAIDGPDSTYRDLFWQGKKSPRVTDTAARLRRFAEAFLAGKSVVIEPPDLPDPARCVFLDLEGLPPYLDELEKIYLWGIKDYRGEKARFLPALADFGPAGDRAGWERFLAAASNLLAATPDLRFVHWGGYEKTAIERYRDRYGDSEIVDRLLAALVDLLAVTRASIVLPIAGYGLKRVEKLVGFDRKLVYDGSRAMAGYIEACETQDSAVQESIVAEILAYNEEDLDATRAVLDGISGLPPS